jgi:hypothetical protein
VDKYCLKGLGEAVLTYTRSNFTSYSYWDPAGKAATARRMIGSMKFALGMFALPCFPVSCPETTLKFRLSVEQWRDLVAQHTDNPEAYDDCLRGVEYVTSYSAEGVLKAREMFENAIELDPAYTDAVWVARLYLFLELVQPVRRETVS